MSKEKVQVTRKPTRGTLSTKEDTDKKDRPAKQDDLLKKMKELLGLNKIRFHSHANKRMGERNVLDYEVRQALSNGKHQPSKDRFSEEHQSWEYSIEGKTIDKRLLRIGISFEQDLSTGERLLVITVIDPRK